MSGQAVQIEARFFLDLTVLQMRRGKKDYSVIIFHMYVVTH